MDLVGSRGIMRPFCVKKFLFSLYFYNIPILFLLFDSCNSGFPRLSFYLMSCVYHKNR